jgi:hypothetical protein
VAVQDDHLALPDSDIEDRLELIEATGATVTRVDVMWADIAPRRPRHPADPADPAYRFERTDAIVRGLADRGITPIIAVYNPPAWASGGPGPTPQRPVNPAPPDAAEYGAFMGALARRYSGRFRDARGERLPRVRYWEIWNEPNLSLYLAPQLDEEGKPVSPRIYAGLVRAAYPRIKHGGGSDTVVIVGSGGPRGRTGEAAIGAFDWLDALRRLDPPLDAYSQHIYPAAPPTAETPAKPSWSSVDELLDELDRWRTGLDLYITEAGYTTSPTPYRRESVVSEEEQAEYLRDMFDLPQVHDPRVRVIVWFNLQDNANWPAGLLREDGSRKPSFAAFREVARREGQRPLR